MSQINSPDIELFPPRIAPCPCSLESIVRQKQGRDKQSRLLRAGVLACPKDAHERWAASLASKARAAEE